MSGDSTRRTLGLAVVTVLGLGCGAGDLPSANEAPVLRVSTSQPLMYGGHDYLFIRTTRTWAQAGALCDGLGYGLVTVNDAQEETFLERFDRGGLWWLGINDIQTEGRWVWRDGTSSYLPWGPGEPNNVNDEDCAVAGYYSGIANWVDISCAVQAYVVCESRE